MLCGLIGEWVFHTYLLPKPLFSEYRAKIGLLQASAICIVLVSTVIIAEECLTRAVICHRNLIFCRIFLNSHYLFCPFGSLLKQCQ